MRINGAALRAIRERSGLTITALAQGVGISQPHLSNVELGRRTLASRVAVQIAAELRVPLAAILADPDTRSRERISREGESGTTDLEA